MEIPCINETNILKTTYMNSEKVYDKRQYEEEYLNTQYVGRGQTRRERGWKPEI